MSIESPLRDLNIDLPSCPSTLVKMSLLMADEHCSTDQLAALIETERSVGTAKAAESGKPADIAAKMIEGAVQKYLKEVSLFNQVFVKAADGKQTVEQYLKSANTEVKGFTMFTVGEGIEKKQEDFAAEVAATLAAAKGQ